MKGLGLRGLSRNIGATLVRQLVAVLLKLVKAVIIARVYGAEGNGAYAIAFLLPSMLASFLNLGVAPANVYYLGSNQVSVRQLLAANIRIFAPVATFGLALGFAILHWKSETFFPGVPPLVLWFALAGFPLGLLGNYLNSVFQGLQQFRVYNKLAIIPPASLLLFVVALTLLGNRELAFLVGAQLVSQLAGIALTIRFLFPILKKEPREPFPENFIKKAIGYGWKAHLSNILAFVNYKADVFLTNLFLGPAAVGVYVVAVALAEKPWLISQAVSTVLLPRLSQLSSDETKRKALTPLIARWVLLVTLLGSLVLALLGFWLIFLVFGPEYSEAILPLWILLPGIVLTSCSRVLANDIAARGRPELNMYTSIVVVVVNVIGNLILIPLYGLPGAAAATTIAYTLNLALRIIVYGRFTGNRWFESLLVTTSDFRMLQSAIRAL
ncbi:MAG: oligosaccharide flippase family protein [Desulfococcaceae bacterium]